MRNLREARAILFRFARQHRGGRVLAVAQKGVREALEGSWPHCPATWAWPTTTAVAGRDEWGAVSGLVVIGRTAAPPQDVERMAEALTGAAVPPIAGWYPRAATVREMAGGEDMAAEADAHPDPVCEAIRWHVTEGELVQIIGRGRGVNRTAAAPLSVLAMTDAPLPVPVHEAIGFADLAPTAEDKMLAECGFAFETPRHAAFACPALWANWETAKSALAKGKKGENPYKNILIGDFTLLPPELCRVDYRRAGQGQGDAVAWFDPLMVADPEAGLTYFLGKLAWWQTAPAPSPPVPGPRLILVPPAVIAEAAPIPSPPEPEKEPQPVCTPTSSPTAHTRATVQPEMQAGMLQPPPPVLGLWTIKRRLLPTVMVAEESRGLRVTLPDVPAAVAPHGRLTGWPAHGPPAG